LYRQLTKAGHTCVVVAPALIPRRAGERVKTDRRDALSLAQLHRAGELSAIWVPDAGHEAMRDLVRARQTAVQTVRRCRQQLSGFLLRHGQAYDGKKAWTRSYRLWLARLRFEHPAQQICRPCMPRTNQGSAACQRERVVSELLIWQSHTPEIGRSRRRMNEGDLRTRDRRMSDALDRHTPAIRNRRRRPVVNPMTSFVA
jgi:transposase